MVPAITARDEMIAPAPGTARTGPPVPPRTKVIAPEEPRERTIAVAPVRVVVLRSAATRGAALIVPAVTVPVEIELVTSVLRDLGSALAGRARRGRPVGRRVGVDIAGRT